MSTGVWSLFPSLLRAGVRRPVALRRGVSRICFGASSSSFRKGSLLIHTAKLASRKQPTASRFSTACEASLASFLSEEIEAEKQLGKRQEGESPNFAGFQIQEEEAEVKLTKQMGSEKITVFFNVNHTVDIDSRAGAAEEPVGEEAAGTATMVARPPFTVEIDKGGQKLGFDCQMADRQDVAEGGSEEAADLFQIEEIYMYAGGESPGEKVYASSASVLDAALYDHLMDYLEERGVDGAFVEQVVHYATDYEHRQYVNLLQKIRDFVGK